MKRALAILLILAFLISLTACAPAAAPDVTTTTAATTADPASTHAVLPDSEEFMYVAEHGAAPEWMRGVNTAVAGNGRFWQYMTNAQSDDPTPFIGSIRAEGNFFERHPYIFEDQHILSALAPIPSEQNCLWFVESVFIPDGRTYESHTLVRVNADGEAVVSDDVTSIIDEREISRSVGVALTDGRYFLCVEDLVCLFDGEGELIFKTTVDQHINYPEAALTSSGEIALLIDVNGARKLYLLDETAQMLKPIGTVNEGVNEIHLAGGDEFFDLYLFDESLWGYHLATGEKTKIVAFSDFGMQPDNLVRILPVGVSETGAPKFGCYEIFGSQISPTVLEQRVKVPEKITLTLGVRLPDKELTDAVSQFNRQSAEYQIEVIQYATKENPDDLSGFSVALSTGDIPDMLALYGLPEHSLIQKKLLRDLTPFMESDPDLSPDMFLPNIYDLLTYYDDALYGLAPGFSIMTMHALRSQAGEISKDWNFADALAVLDANPGLIQPIAGDRTSFMQTYIMFAAEPFVDWQNLTSSFDSEEFLRLLEFISRFPKEKPSEYDSNMESLAAGEAMLMFDMGVTSPLAYFSDFRARFGTDLQTPGFPASGSTVLFYDKIAITTYCMYPEGAWEFIRSFILGVDGEDLGFEIPVLESEYKAMLDYWHSYYAEHNDSIYNGQPLYQPTEEDFAAYDAIIRNAKSEQTTDRYVLPIMVEEIQAFLDGVRSAEETAEVIQSRVALVLAEMQ